ncbi:MAG: single-stranded-DNA-specific exonuclease RecJ [Gemmatimonadota bacterium]|nr:single-stranded-DNA-specific exonuclease RecJ [Gemmatimonadota bacterium]
MSRPPSRWIAAPTLDAAAVASLSAALGVNDSVARLLLHRGYDAPDAAKRFLRPRLDQLHAGNTMKSLDVAVDRLARAIRAGELIMIHGDYDVDGICSTTLLVRAIRGLGGNVQPFIPNRMTDGYDLGAAGVDNAVRIGAKVVVTCDCGTSALDPVVALNAAGIDVVISDHHLSRGQMPAALALLNPRRPDCDYPDKDLAAVGVAFKLALALASELGANDAFIWKMLDLVALATIADVASLRGENRVFVRYGMRMISDTENLGLRALLRSSGMDGKPLTAGRIGFTLAPRLNAAGRIGHAMRGVELLLTESAHEANTIARELEELNQRRQALDRATLDEARTIAEQLVRDGAIGLVIARDGWHPGVIGIVASRIVEEFCRPTVLVAMEGDTGKGSGRSVSGFDLHSALGECADLLLRYGGHRAAAGVTVAASRVDAFARRFDEVARASLGAAELAPQLRIDAEIRIDQAALELDVMLRHFEPYGVGNPSPVFAARNVTALGAPRIVGRDGLKLTLLGDGGTQLEAIGWGMAPLAPSIRSGAALDVAFRMERDEYKGVSRLQARLADIVVR